MLSKPYRLTRGFPILFRKGKRISSPFFLLRFLPAHDERHRLAIIVSKKTEKTAVGRNRIRRRLIEAVKKTGYPTNIKTPVRIALFGNRSVKTADFEKLVISVEESFLRIRK